MRHTFERLGRKHYRCRDCMAEYTMESNSRCPAVPLYRGVTANDLAATGLFTRTELKRRARVLVRGSPRAAVLENAYHQRFPLYFLAQTVERPARTDAQRAAWASSRARRGICGRCQTRPDDLIRRPEYKGHCSRLLTVDRVCWACYHAI